MLATTADAGDPNSLDPVARQSDKIAAAVALYPPTDIRGWTTNPPDAIKAIPALKPPLAFDASREPDLSPLLHVTADTAPTLLIHGDKDPLVPIEHSRHMIAALEKMHVTSNLIVIEGAGHGFQGAQNDQSGKAAIAWFDKILLPAPTTAPAK
jgi:dipeptidyl aminopeptidase/acylaminoacyl peptidase